MTTVKHPTIVDTPDDRTVAAVVELAQRAPSVHNTQPWRWTFDGRRLLLHSDPDRVLPGADPHGREQVISCGVVLHHARTALAARDWHTDIVRLPDPQRPDLMAVLDFRPWSDPPNGIPHRAAAITHRYSDRLPMDAPTHWEHMAPRLRGLVTPHGLDLHEFADDIRARVAAISRAASAARRDDWMYQDELHWWAGNFEASEGVPASGLVSDAERARVDVARAFPSAPHSERRPGRLDHARLVAISSPEDSREYWLRSGEALSAVLLECTAAGLGSCPVTHLTEVPAGRRALAALLPHHDFPQVLVRIGSSPTDEPDPPSTPRRAVDEVLTITGR
ncbi:Acg family FMN-binding oxidoreductase [Nocardia africana]